MANQSPSLLQALRAPSTPSAPSTDGVIQWIHDLFRMASVDPSTAIDFDETNEAARVELAEKIYAFYRGDFDDVLEYVKAAMAPTFGPLDIAQFQYTLIPLFRRVIEKTCCVYSAETERYVGVESESDKFTDILHASNILTAQYEWHQLAKAFDTVLVRPVVRGGVLQFDILTPDKCVVIEDPSDYLVPAKVYYAEAVRGEDGKSQIQYVFWSADEHYVLDGMGKRLQPGGKNGDYKNPYNVIPFVPLRMRRTENFWGEGATVLMNAEEKIDILLSQLNHLLIMQGFGQPVFVNAKVEGSVRTGPSNPLSLIAHDPTQAVDFKFVSSTGHAAEIQGAVDWQIERIATMYGLSKSSLMEQSQSSSGYAKLLDSWDMVEIRNRDMVIVQDFERRLFEVTAQVLAVEGLGDFIGKDFYVEFEEFDYPVEPKSEYETKKLKAELGLWSPVEDLMKDDPTLTREAAIKIIQDNLEVNGLVNGRENANRGDIPKRDTLKPDGSASQPGEMV